MRLRLHFAILLGAALAAAPAFSATFECGTESPAPTRAIRWTSDSNEIAFLLGGEWTTVYGPGVYCGYRPADASAPVECPFRGSENDSPAKLWRNLLCQELRQDGSRGEITTGELQINPKSGHGRIHCEVFGRGMYGFKLTGCHPHTE